MGGEDYADEGERNLAERDLTTELKNTQMGTSNYNGPPVIYRVRVEQRPDENSKRYYPETAIKIDRTGYIRSDAELSWINIMVSLRWYQSLVEAQNEINKLVDLKKNYTIETIPYSPIE